MIKTQLEFEIQNFLISDIKTIPHNLFEILFIN